jgi:hypothetical protein
MTNPWNLKKEDTRQSDSLPNFIIFCEDEVSEPIYLRYFETSLIKVNPVKKQLSKIDNVLKAITYCIEIGLLDPKKSGCIQGENTHVWCVFDRDLEGEPAKVTLGNTSFNESIKSALASGLKVAWSNDSFELWILLHFESIDTTDAEYKNRNKYYERLTEIFKTLPKPNDDLTKALRHASFSYKQDCKSENNFRNIVRSEIVGNTNLAIERSEQLEDYFNKLGCADNEKVPCTLMHNLVKELLQFGKKEL